MASTETVCIAATEKPSQAASRTRPREPIRYAAARLLPWPGASPCTAPATKAITSATGTNPGDCTAANSQSPKPATPTRSGRAVDAGREPVPVPAPTVQSADSWVASYTAFCPSGPRASVR